MDRSRYPLFLLVALVACGGPSSPPTAPSPPPSPGPPPAGDTTGRLISALNPAQGIADATVQGDFGSASSNSQGYFALQASVAATYNIRVTQSVWVERHTLLKVPGESTNVSLIPASVNMTYFDEMCRGFGELLRWGTAPALVVETAVIEYGSRLATSETVSTAHVERTMEEMRRTLPVLSAGRFADYASIEVRRTPEGTASRVPAGAVGLTWQRGLLNGFGHVAYGGRSPGAADGGLNQGEVALDDQWHVLGLPAGSRRDFFNVVQHELGHALGYSHTKTAPSFMYEVFLMTVSALDRDAFEIYMQRPSGNRTPDVDPSGVSLNIRPGPQEMLIPRCAFLTR